jgi:hypothetical protein
MKEARSKIAPSTAPTLATPVASDFVVKLKLTQIRAASASQTAAQKGNNPEWDDDDAASDSSSEYGIDDDLETKVVPTRRQFCPEGLRPKVIALLERHYCAHPDIPGFSRPDAEGIHTWAVKQMYTFCIDHDLRELWAYLWGNWYRRGRWNLWAHSKCEEIPRLKTNMICESQ